MCLNAEEETRRVHSEWMIRSSHPICQRWQLRALCSMERLDRSTREAVKGSGTRERLSLRTSAVIADNSWRVRNSVRKCFGVARASLNSTVSAPHNLMCGEHMDLSPLANDMHDAYIISKSPVRCASSARGRKHRLSV